MVVAKIFSPTVHMFARYRMKMPAGTRMPEYPSPRGRPHCGGGWPGRIYGTHPTEPGESKQVLFCFGGRKL